MNIDEREYNHILFLLLQKEIEMELL